LSLAGSFGDLATPNPYSKQGWPEQVAQRCIKSNF